MTTEQMQSARVVSDMRSTNRVRVRANEEVVYRLADCDGTDKNAPCYVVVSAQAFNADLQQPVLDKTLPFTKNLFQTINRNMTLHCSVTLYTGLGGAVSGLSQRVGVIFHSNNNAAPVTLQWGDLGDTWAGAFFRRNSTSGPNPNPGWGSRTNSQAVVNTSGSGETGTPSPFGWVTLAQRTANVGLGINSSGWWCF